MTNSRKLLLGVGVVAVAVGGRVFSGIVRCTATSKHAYDAKSKKDNYQFLHLVTDLLR